MSFKPMLADNKAKADEVASEACRFPKLISPKLDGIRCVMPGGIPLTRSLKEFPNRYVHACLSELGTISGAQFDGELIVGEPTDPDVYRKTNSAVMSKDGEPVFTFFVFDSLAARDIPFKHRLLHAKDFLARVTTNGNFNLKMVPQITVNTVEEILAAEQGFLEEGYEGAIVRDPDAPYKFGRSTWKEQAMLKLKRFVDDEALVIGVEEKMHNGNEAFTSELGRTKRSSHQENLTGLGTLGALVCKTKEGIEFRIGSFRGWDDDYKQKLWNIRSDLPGQLIKYTSFPVGVKEAPRHPVALGFREFSDL